MARYKSSSSATDSERTCLLKLWSASLPLTGLPDERGQQNAIEGWKRLHKQLLRKEAGAPALIDLQPRQTNLIDESCALAFPLGSATAGPSKFPRATPRKSSEQVLNGCVNY